MSMAPGENTAGPPSSKVQKKHLIKRKMILSLDKQNKELAYLMGREKMLDGDFEAALPYLKTALAASPNNSSIQASLGEVYFRLGNYDEAEALLLAVIHEDKKGSKIEDRLS